MVAELHVHDIAASLRFWCDLLGFEIAYQRAEEKFAYLQRDEGGQIMLCQCNGRFETGPMRPPLGQGAMFQVAVDALDPVLSRLSVAGWPLYQPAREAWRRTGDAETRLRSGPRRVSVDAVAAYRATADRGCGVSSHQGCIRNGASIRSVMPVLG